MASKPGVRRDDEGFEDIDDYFDLTTENKNPNGVGNAQKTASSFLVSPIAPSKTPVAEAVYHEYDQPVDFADVDYDHPNTFEVEPDNVDEEVSFGKSVVVDAQEKQQTMTKPGKKANKLPTNKKPAVPRPKQQPKSRLAAAVASDKYGTALAEDGRRKTQRQRMAPLLFWENEKVKYGRRNSLGKLCLLYL